jgi:LPXTG-motif cell wall-anchored protein
MRRSMFLFPLLAIAAGALLFAPAAGAQPGSISFDPSSTVRAGGGKTFFNVKCEANAPSFLFSHAFANLPGGSEFAGVPAFSFTTSPSGTFGQGFTVDPSVPAGTYSVSLRCGGGLAATTTLTVLAFELHPGVQPLPRTGARDDEMAGVGAIALAAGAALLAMSRRRARSRAT